MWHQCSCLPSTRKGFRSSSLARLGTVHNGEGSEEEAACRRLWLVPQAEYGRACHVTSPLGISWGAVGTRQGLLQASTLPSLHSGVFRVMAGSCLQEPNGSALNMDPQEPVTVGKSPWGALKSCRTNRAVHQARSQKTLPPCQTPTMSELGQKLLETWRVPLGVESRKWKVVCISYQILRSSLGTLGPSQELPLSSPFPKQLCCPLV